MVYKPHLDLLEEKIALLESKLSLFETLEGDPKINNIPLKALFDIIPVPLFYKDVNCIYQQCNIPFAENILGLKMDEIIGKSVFDFESAIPKFNADIYYKQDNELFDAGGQQSYETKVFCADGVEREYLFYKSVFMIKNIKVGIIGIMLDISRYENMKKELDNIITALTDCKL